MIKTKAAIMRAAILSALTGGNVLSDLLEKLDGE